MDQLCRVVSGQVYLGTQKHQKLELSCEIYLGSSKFTGDSFQEFMPYRTSHIQADCILLTILSFEGQVIHFHYVVYMWCPDIEDSLSPWTWTTSPTSSWVCPYCNKSYNSRDSLMNHIHFHYRMVLVCPICGGCGSNQWRTVEGHIKKCAAAQPNVAGRVKPGKPH